MDKILYGILAFVFGFSIGYSTTVLAATSYGSGSLLQVGDVKSSHILDGTIVNVDVSSTAAISATKVAGGGVGGHVLISGTNSLATSTNLRYATSTNHLYVFGGSIEATSTNFGGVDYTWPATAGTSGYSLVTNGAGTLSWSVPNAMQKIWSTATQASTNQTSSTTIFQFAVPANTLSTSNAIKCEFISDSAVYVQSGSPIWVDISYGGNASSTVQWSQSSGSAKGGYFDIILQGNGSTGSQRLSQGSPSWNGAPFHQSSALSVDSTQVQVFTLVARGTGASEGIIADQADCVIIR